MTNLTKEQADERMGHLGGSSEGYVNKVDDHEHSWGVVFSHDREEKEGFGTGFTYDKKFEAPKVGDYIRVYTEGLTHIVGADLNGVPLFYNSKADRAEQRARNKKESDARRKANFEKNKDRLLAEYDALPQVFKDRIDWFRLHCPENFDHAYLSYELMCCTSAVIIAEGLKKPSEVKRWIEKGYRKRKALQALPRDAHSSNTMGMAARLAYAYLEDERMVFFEHGAMVPLVGCGKYGCAHPRPGIEEYLKEKGVENA